MKEKKEKESNDVDHPFLSKEEIAEIEHPKPKIIPKGLTTRDLDSKTLQYKPERKKR